MTGGIWVTRISLLKECRPSENNWKSISVTRVSLYKKLNAHVQCVTKEVWTSPLLAIRQHLTKKFKCDNSLHLFLLLPFPPY